jgi:hypothetical protein
LNQNFDYANNPCSLKIANQKRKRKKKEVVERDFISYILTKYKQNINFIASARVDLIEKRRSRSALMYAIKKFYSIRFAQECLSINQ